MGNASSTVVPELAWLGASRKIVSLGPFRTALHTLSRYLGLRYNLPLTDWEKAIQLGEPTRNFPHRQAFALTVAAFVTLLFGPLTANAADYYSTYGQSRVWNVTLPAAGTRTFEVDGIAQYKTTYWFVNGVYKETDSSGLFAIDPDYSWSFSSGTTDIEADVYNSDNSFREYHLWHVTIQATRAPTTPGTISVSEVTTNGATLSWGASSDPDGDSVTYEVQYTQTFDASDPWHSLGTSTSTSVILTGFNSGTTYSVRVNASDGRGGVSDWSTKDPAFTPLYPKTIISAYWLTPVYVTEGAVVTMRAQVSGYNVGDQFAFEIREDDGILGYDYVTTKYGNIYSSGGNYYVDATWTTVWQSDQSGDPEFFFVVSNGGAAFASSTVDANEMHVTQALDPYGVGALEPSGIGLFSTIPVEHRNNLTDLANLKNNGLYYGSRLVNSTDRKLIVAIHGWNGTPLTSISDAINTAIAAGKISENWRVIAYDWSNDAATGDTYGTLELKSSNSSWTGSGGTAEPNILFEGGATEAAEHAYQHGLLLGAKILQQVGANNLDAVHLIGHSAGSWTVYGAMRYLYAHADPSTLIQVTYLDPYEPAEVLFNNNPNFTVAQLESSPNFCRVVGQYAVKAEQDWSESVPEDSTYGTDTPFSWTSAQGVVFRTDGFPYGDTNWNGHSGPIVFYVDTINDPNHPQASENGWKHSLEYNDDISPPALTIASPVNGAVVTSASLPVNGTASDNGYGNNGVFSVTVNGASASGGTASGTATANWSATVTLVSGMNTITVVAKDTLNNSTQKVVSVTYNPPRPTFGGSSVTGGKLQTTLTGLSVGENIVFYVSSDLKIWTPLQTNSVLTGSTLTFTNTINPAMKSQFFRAVVQ